MDCVPIRILHFQMWLGHPDGDQLNPCVAQRVVQNYWTRKQKGRKLLVKARNVLDLIF